MHGYHLAIVGYTMKISVDGELCRFQKASVMLWLTFIIFYATFRQTLQVRNLCHPTKQVALYNLTRHDITEQHRFFLARPLYHLWRFASPLSRDLSFSYHVFSVVAGLAIPKTSPPLRASRCSSLIVVLSVPQAMAETNLKTLTSRI